MSEKKQSSEFIQRMSVFFSLVLFAFAFALSVSALLTEFWLEANELERNGTLSRFSFVHSGLFRGSRQIEWTLAPRYTQFSVFDEVQRGVSFLDKTQLIFIIFLVALSIFWTTVGLLISLLNTVVQPVNDVTGPAGIILWSVLAVASNGIAAIIFLYSYSNSIQNNVLLTEHIRAGFSSKNRTSLGFSFWLLIGSIFAQLLPILLSCLTCDKEKSTTAKKSSDFESHDVTILMY